MKHYSIPAVGAILPAKQNETVENPGPVNDSIARTRWEQAQAQQEAFRQTQLRATEDLAHFNDSWLVNYRMGRVRGPLGTGDPDAAPPRPRAALAVEVKEAEAGGLYFDIVDSPTEPCCVYPAFEKITAPAVYKDGPKAKR